MEGEYRFGWKNSEKAHFYRFTEPRSGYPSMIELFSREPDYINYIPEGIIPIHIDENTSSLSAILLNDDYYKFMLAGRRIVSGISVLDTEHLIPFKMYAWLDLKELLYSFVMNSVAHNKRMNRDTTSECIKNDVDTS